MQEKKKKGRKFYQMKEKAKKKTTTSFSDYCVTEHTNISQKGFAVMLKSNCKSNWFNKKEGSGTLNDSASQSSG